MATAKFDIKTEALKPVLAGVGVTDLAVEVVRDAVADVQKRVTAAQKRASKTAADPKAVVVARRAARLLRRKSGRRGQGKHGQREHAGAEGSYHGGLLKNQVPKYDES